MNQPNKNARKKTLLNDWRQPHPTSIDPLPGAQFPAQLMFELTGGEKPKIVLKVHDGIYKEGGKSTHKEVEMDYNHEGMLFEAILEATNNPEFTFKQFAVQWKGFVNGSGGGRMSESPILHVNLSIIRDKQGRILLGWSKGDYKTQFLFKPKESLIYTKNEAGERVVDESATSRWAARAWVNFHRPILRRIREEIWTPHVPKDRGGQPGRSNQNNNSSSHDDDGFDDTDF